MKSSAHQKPAPSARRNRFRIFACITVLAFGIIGMLLLSSLKNPPAEVVHNEKPLRVDALKMVPEDVQASISGFGEVRSLNVVNIAPEISGKVVRVHPRLEPGEIIPSGQVLFQIDDSDYKAARTQAEASVNQLTNAIERLEKQHAIDQQRLKTLKRNRTLTKAEFDRTYELYEKDSVGTRSGVESAERAYNNAVDQYDQLRESVSLYPTRRKEAQNNLISARAKHIIAKKNLERCQVRALFNARIKEVNLEAGQYVSPGQSVLILADDSVLEIQVPLDSRDARNWLQFREKVPDLQRSNWFRPLLPVTCRIQWTEDDGAHHWEGLLHRIIKFDQQTRTLTVAVRIDASQKLSHDHKALPLVDGMFCSVEIPGRLIRGVYRLPRWAVTFEETVYLISDRRLKTVPVQVAYASGEQVYISLGLQPGDVVIVTRLIDPLENALVESTLLDREG